MIYFEKIISSLILPPGIFIVLLFILFLICLISNKKSLSIFAFLITLLFYLSSIEIISNKLIGNLENKYKPIKYNELSQASAYMVLGGGTIAKSPEENFSATPSLETLKRLHYTISLFNQYQLPVIVVGGESLCNGGFSESYVMTDFLYKEGVDKTSIISEGKSRNTIESAINVKKINEKFKFDTIILITSAYHMPRAVYIFKKLNISVIPAPTDYKNDNSPICFLNFFPSLNAFSSTCKAIHEYIGLLYYKLI